MINNGPDREAENQPESAALAAAAARVGLDYRHVPVVSGKITDDDDATFAQALEGGEPLIRWSGRAPSRLRGSTSIAATGGHDYTGAGEVLIAGRRRGLTPTMRRELRRRSALEAIIGHAKDDHRMGRNFLLGSFGDAINALAARPRPFDQKVKRSPACSP